MKTLYYFNIIVILVYLVVIFLGYLGPFEDLAKWFNSEQIANFRLLANIPILIFWIKLIVHWSKGEKKVWEFLLLFFLIGWYTVFYYRNHFIKKKSQ